MVWVASAAVCGGAGALQLLGEYVLPLAGNVLYGRVTGFTTHPNDLGGLTAVAFIPALMLAARSGITAPQRLLSYVCLLLVGAGLILSGSVGALFAAAAATFVWFAFQRTSPESIVVFAAVGVCVIGGVTVQALRGAPTPLERFDRVTAPRGRSREPDRSIRALRHIASRRMRSRSIPSSAWASISSASRSPSES